MVFPHDNSDEEYERLPDLVKRSGMGNGDYVGCKKGHITLWMPSPLHYKENNLNRTMTHYLRDRGISVENGSHMSLSDGTIVVNIPYLELPEGLDFWFFLCPCVLCV